MDALKRLAPHKLILLKRQLQPLWAKITRKNTRRKNVIQILHFHLADHCNLNCRGCDNFSPIAKERFADTTVFENDCRRMSRLIGKRNIIRQVQLLGGEPLLHPQVTEFMAIARRYFPETRIEIVSNGVLLPKQDAGFWKCCRDNDIHITVTKYPVKIDYAKIERLAADHGVSYSYYGSTGVVEKTMQCVPIDIEGRQDSRDSFLRCSRANRCISLEEGRIYTCSMIPYVKYFNEYFKKNLIVSENDYLDIYKVDSIDDILDFIRKPMPFCRYCNIKGTILDIKFGVSRKEMKEWTGRD